MRTIVVALLACVASPALADVYRCNSGGKTIYQDAPCPNAKLIDNINGQAPSRHEQMKAIERTAREQAIAAQLSKARQAEGRKVTTTLTTIVQTPAAPKPNRPDRYYDRPDRYENRTVSVQRSIQNR